MTEARMKAKPAPAAAAPPATEPPEPPKPAATSCVSSVLVALVTVAVATLSEGAMAQTPTQAEVTSHTIAVEHIRIASQRSFAEVRQRLEDTLPQLDASIVEALSNGNQNRAKEYGESGPKLSIFEVRDHGDLLELYGAKRNARQYEIGNPLTASTMTRYQLPAALYAPLRVVLFGDEQGRGIFEYDKPSSFFGQFGDERVTKVGRYLDVTLDAALRKAAE
jgi:hypothetical protein